MKKLFYLTIAILVIEICHIANVYAQNGGVGINTTNAAADPSAILDASSTTKGQLMPRMTAAQRDAITNPAEGLVIYNTDCKTFNYNAGTPAAPVWVTLNSSNALVAGVSITASPAGAICAGVIVTFTAIPTSGLTSPSYQWKVNGGDVGTNNSVYSTSGLNNGDVVTCVLTANAPCVSGSPASSNSITMVVNASPSITGTAPASRCGTGTLTLGATSTTGTINWYASSSGGTSLGSGTSFTTPSISSTTTYYVDASLNSCTSTSRTAVAATVSSTIPSQPGAITGLTGNLGGATNVSYSIAAVGSAASYTWSVPAGVSLSGQGGTAITANFTCSGSGTIGVTANNVCGSSSQQILSVSTTVTSGPIIGPGSVNRNASGVVYSATYITPGSVYTWTVPAGATITSGQNTGSITVTFGSSSGTGNVTVYVSNSCGTSTTQTLSVNIGTQTFSYTGSTQTFAVPSGVSQVFVKLWGAGGGGGWDGTGGSGAFVSGNLSVTAGSNLTVIVGGGGKVAVSTASISGGYGGGGASGNGAYQAYMCSSGAGRSAIQISPGSDAVTAAGGGGGGASNATYNPYGGGGGAPNGSHGANGTLGYGSAAAGKGATTTAGGPATTASGQANSVAGSSQTGSDGGSSSRGGGGGGGGYYGGSGGAGGTGNDTGGGGGGSSYTANLTGVINLAGTYGNSSSANLAPNSADVDYVSGTGNGAELRSNGGNGLVVISW